jgi:hypothetical protein
MHDQEHIGGPDRLKDEETSRASGFARRSVMWVEDSGAGLRRGELGGRFSRGLLVGCPRRLRRQCLCGWLVASVLWLGGLGGLAAVKIDDQVRASHDLAGDIARLDCPTAPATCERAGAKPHHETWRDVADVVWTFGGSYVLAVALLPPAILLILGGGALWVRHARPRPVGRRSA